MRRREFVVALGSATVMPLTTRAQQRERMRRVGALLPTTADDAEFQTFFGAFLQTLSQLGWHIGSNVRVDVRWATGNIAIISKHAAELAALAPDVILVHGGATVSGLLQVTTTIPIVFTAASDPVAAGYVDSLARPGRNITGFMTAEFATAGKWLELLKEVAPGVTRVAILRDPRVPAALGQFGAIQNAAASLGIEVTALNVGNASEIERSIAAFARLPNGGMIVSAGSLVQQHRDLIVSLMAQHKLPAVYYNRTFVNIGGLASSGVDFTNQYRRAAAYVDRVLKGEKPGELPIQAPTQYELTINLKAAKALGLTVPPTLLARADEVIE
jgi:putative tryptophan/tyrosine transport system substrate-binding protein